jgi:MATE family multidrug resistance protein
LNQPGQASARARLGSFRPVGADLAELLRLAFPVVVVQVGTMLMGVVDTVMVGHVSPTDLAAVALGSLYFFGCTIVGMGVLYGLDPLLSQAVGARDHEGIARSLQRGLLLAAGLGVVTSLLMLPAGPIFSVLRQPPDVVPVAAAYVHATILGVVPFYAFVAFRQTLQALGRIGPIVAAVVFGNVANVALNWMLIFGNLGAPALGAVGSGWASTLARWLMAAALVAFSWRWVRPYSWPPRPQARAWVPMRGVLALGIPIGLQIGLEFSAFGGTGVLMGWLGTAAMAGHQIALNLASLTFMVPLGIAQATGVLVGRAVGREDPSAARRAAGAGLMAGALFMAGTALLFLTVPDLFARQYSSDPEVLAVAVALIPLAGLFQIFDGLQVVSSHVLRGVADTRAPMLVNILGFWVVGLPISLWLGFRTDAGPVGLWWGLVVGLAAVAAFLLARIRRRFGGELKRLVLAGH